MNQEEDGLPRPRINPRNYSVGLEPQTFFRHDDGGKLNDDDDNNNNETATEFQEGSSGVDNRKNPVQAMGERPLAFQLVAQAKKYSRRNIDYDPNSSFTRRKRGDDGKLDDGGRIPTEESSLLLSITEERSIQKSIPYSWEALHDIVFGKLVSVFLIFIPFCFLAKTLNWGPVWVFWFNFFVMIPLAAILGDFTEEVAAHTNQVIGGLVNATFGNAVEVVVAIQALLANEIRVVQASMIGSIFSNLLLVLGCCFFFGGIKHKEQPFNQTAATANMSLLALSSIALVLPTPFAEYYQIDDARVLLVSRTAAFFLMSMYVQLLIFQLRTHAYLFEDENDEDPRLSMRVALIGLCVSTLAITVFSDMLVESIDGFVVSTGISRTFVGLIILPIVGNAVEHITAVTVAMKNKMDLAMGVAVGSCTQISLFVVPFTVLIGWALNRNMTLNFPAFEITLYTLSVVIVSICLSNPKGNWLLGSLLITTYVMVAVGFFFEDVKDF